jgi:hypothetical protein
MIVLKDRDVKLVRKSSDPEIEQALIQNLSKLHDCFISTGSLTA